MGATFRRSRRRPANRYTAGNSAIRRIRLSIQKQVSGWTACPEFIRFGLDGLPFIQTRNYFSDRFDVHRLRVGNCAAFFCKPVAVVRSLSAPNNASSCQIVRRKFNTHLVAWQNPDVIFPQLSGDVS